MVSPKIQADDQERVRILKLYNILRTEAEDDYNAITQLANSICGTKVSLVSFMDKDSQWFKAYTGMDFNETSREVAFCAHTINEPNITTYVPDTRKDIRFKYNPFVTGPTKFHFYTGVPILSREGYALGTLCVLDNAPKRLNQQQLSALETLRDLTAKFLEIRRDLLEKA